jgi:hypothetical protein
MVNQNIVDSNKQDPIIQLPFTNNKQSEKVDVVESELLLTTTAHINNIPIEVVIDTACSRSVIPQHFVDEYKFKTFQTDITCTFGNSSQANNCYITENLTVSLHDNTNKLTFIVLPRKMYY